MVTNVGSSEAEEQYYYEKGEWMESSIETSEEFYSPIYALHLTKTGDSVHAVAGNNMGVKGWDREVPIHDYSDYVLYVETFDEEQREYFHFHPFPFDIELCD